MASKNRTVHNVDEDTLKRMVAGDISALEKMKEQEEQPAEETGISEPMGEKEEKPVTVVEKKPSGGKKIPQAYGFDDYREQFLHQKLTGARRQTYIHDSLYRAFAKILPVIAPEMSVPTFVNNVLAEHLKKYQGIINEMYSQEANQKAVEWEI